jgi:hypothetical protein
MKKIIIAIVIAASALSCYGKKITEKEFSILWQEYLSSEFEESFDEKQSVLQKEKILAGVLSGHGVSMEEYKLYLKEKHVEKYNKIFVE